MSYCAICKGKIDYGLTLCKDPNCFKEYVLRGSNT